MEEAGGARVGREILTVVRFARLAVAALFSFFLLNLGFFAIDLKALAKFFSSLFHLVFVFLEEHLTDTSFA